MASDLARVIQRAEKELVEKAPELRVFSPPEPRTVSPDEVYHARNRLVAALQYSVECIRYNQEATECNVTKEDSLLYEIGKYPKDTAIGIGKGLRNYSQALWNFLNQGFKDTRNRDLRGVINTTIRFSKEFLLDSTRTLIGETLKPTLCYTIAVMTFPCGLIGLRHSKEHKGYYF